MPVVLALIAALSASAAPIPDEPVTRLWIEQDIVDLPEMVEDGPAAPTMHQSLQMAANTYDLGFLGIDALGNLVVNPERHPFWNAVVEQPVAGVFVHLGPEGDELLAEEIEALLGGASPPRRAVPIDLEDLSMQLEGDLGEAYLDLETGRILSPDVDDVDAFEDLVPIGRPSRCEHRVAQAPTAWRMTPVGCAGGTRRPPGD